jgi:hypothetical protein
MSENLYSVKPYKIMGKMKFIGRPWISLNGYLEARAGIEPALTDLQSAA